MKMKAGLGIKPVMKQKMGMRMSHLLSISEREFRDYTREIEEDTVFSLLKDFLPVARLQPVGMNLASLLRSATEHRGINM